MSLIAQRHFANSSTEVQTHMERLSSGERINKAADDAAGFAISEGLRADLRSLAQARRNTNDGVSLIQVAEGGLSEIGNIMIRLRELAIQSASDTIGVRERGYLNREFTALKDEMDRIALGTEFNGTRLLTGNAEVPEALLKDHTRPPLEIQVDKEYYPDIDGIDKPNPLNIIKLDFSKMNLMTEGEGSLELGGARSADGTLVDSKEHAQMSISKIDDAMQKVSSYRADMGALQNRLQSADNNLAVRIENLGAARSRIRDADFAQETSEYTQQSILNQAGASILTQANQLPQVALKLLQN
jgi:flagellin